MKKLLLALLIFSAGTVRAQAGNDLQHEGLQGRVKTVTEIQYYDKSQKHAGTKTVEKYDSRGYLVEEAHNDYVLKLNTKKVMKYDTTSAGNVSKRQEYDETGSLVSTTEYKYDSLNHIIEKMEHRSSDRVNVTYKSEYQYDSTGKKVKDKTFTNGTLNYATTYTYNEQGKVATAKSLDKDGRVSMLLKYFYQSHDLWVLCEKETYGVRSHLFQTLDTAGLLIEKRSYTNDYSKRTTEVYSNFDKNGNWLKVGVNGTIIEDYFIHRTIEYYK